MRAVASLIILMMLILTGLAAAQPEAPEKFLGFKVGADRKLANYETIQKYFRHLAGKSDRIRYEAIGKTTQGREMFMAILSSAENMKDLERYRDTIRKLSDPRTLDEAAARELAKAGKSVVLVSCNIHSTEIGAAQMSMELAWKLATGQGEAARALDDVILLLIPSLNPDGLDMVVEWYDKYQGTENETGSLPFLYHPYAGHDNNRDWFMFNLAETRNTAEVVFRRWLPQVWIDEHQMGATGPRLYLTPRNDPLNPNVHPMQWRWQNLLGGVMMMRLEERGFAGVIDNTMYDGWWQGGTSCGMWHNQVCILSEMASVNLASPIYIDPSEVKATEGITTYDIRSNYPHPWRGGWWHLRDIVEYELTLTEALVRAASDYREDLLLSYYRLCQDAVERGKRTKPRTVIIPRRQNDPPTVARMIEALQRGGVEVRLSTRPLTVGNTTYPGENYIIDLAQPNGRYARDLFEAQRYPDLRKTREDAPLKPYDIAGWTLPYLMGVDFTAVDGAAGEGAALLKDAHYPGGAVPEVPRQWYVAPAGPNNNARLINRLQAAGVPVMWTTRAMKTGAMACRPGTVVFESAKTSASLVRQAAAGLHLEILAAESVAGGEPRPLKKVRAGMFQSYGPNADEGWTRLLLENHEFDFVTLHNKDMKEKGLRKRYDVIVLPSESAAAIRNGKSGDDAPPWPAQYRGGIGKEGVDNLKKFVEEDGGTVIALGEACNFAIDDLGARARNTLKTATNDEFYCPGSLLRVTVDPAQPIGYGMPEEVAGYQMSRVALATSPPGAQYDRTIVARYPDRELLKSGYLLGEDLLYQKAAVVDLKQKKGHIVLMGLRVQNRHQTYGTFKLLFNAIHAAGME